jgi:hypothetical protein
MGGPGAALLLATDTERRGGQWCAGGRLHFVLCKRLAGVGAEDRIQAEAKAVRPVRPFAMPRLPGMRRSRASRNPPSEAPLPAHVERRIARCAGSVG